MIKRTSFQRIQAQVPAPTWHAIYTYIFVYNMYIHIQKQICICVCREKRGGERRGRRGRERQIKAK